MVPPFRHPWTHSHSRVHEDATLWSCMINHLIFANDLVLLAQNFGWGKASSILFGTPLHKHKTTRYARDLWDMASLATPLVCSCVESSENEN